MNCSKKLICIILCIYNFVIYDIIVLDDKKVGEIMKEAAGEANLTVVAIILIGVIVAVVTPLVNSLMKSAKGRACCTDAGGYVQGTTCHGGTYDSYEIADIDCTTE